MFVRTQVQLTRPQLEALKRRAAAGHLSVAALVRQAVDQLLDQERDGADVQTRALAACGRFSSGLSDVSENHDDYLADAYAGE